MRNAKHIVALLLVIVVGVLVMARLDWVRDRQEHSARSIRSGERLVSLLSLFPASDANSGTRSILAKTLVEQSAAEGVAYLLIQNAEGESLLALGDLSQRVASAIPVTMLGNAGPMRQTFSATDGPGDIVEFVRPLANGDSLGGSVVLGLRVMPPAIFSASRTSSTAVVAFLMIAAMVVGYYIIVRSVAGLSNVGAIGSFRDEDSGIDGGAGRGQESIVETVTNLDQRLTVAKKEIMRMDELNSELSSRLGVATFEKTQAYRVLDSLDFGILILDAKERVRHMNSCMLRLTGLQGVAVQDRSCREVVDDDAIGSLIEGQGTRVNGDHSCLETEFTKTTPGRFFRLSCGSLMDSKREHIGTLLTAQDITRAKLAERAQDDFIAQVAHELFTPLTSMKTYAEMLMTGDISDPEMQGEFYNTINNETDRLTDLIKNLLNVSKMETGSLTIERAMVKTDWLLEQCMPAVEATAISKEISIETELPDVYPTVMGDKDLLKVILINLLGNAVKYTPEKGMIRISVLEQDGSVFFEISDTGCGIPPDELPHVFEKFYRGASSDVRAQTGSGLGLATAVQIAKLHGGSLTVQSEVGKGSCFVMRIPAEAYSFEKQ